MHYSNTSAGGAAGIYAGFSSSPVITDCLISNNINSGYYAWGGGGMFLAGGLPKITGCTISNNKAKKEGGGIALSGNAQIRNCLISGNELSGTDTVGAGIFIEGNSAPKISNCSIVDNKNTGYNGGGIYAEGRNAAPQIINCTFAGNDAASGLSFYADNYYSNGVSITNSILWNDGDDREIYGSVVVSYSNVKLWYEGVYNGIGNIQTDPMFADPANGDYHLQIGSPCIDTGTATGAPSDDIDGEDRPQQGKMGIQSDDGQEFDRGSDEYFWVGCTSDADCEDDNACTDDSCVAGDCVNENDDTNSCDDGNPCNVGDYCDAGECQPGTAMDCSSGVKCNYEDCGDGIDNDCDGRVDDADEACGACFLDISSTGRSFDHNGGTGEFDIYLGEDCYRQISKEDSWIEIDVNDAWGQGGRTIPYTVSANTTYNTRVGTITVKNHTTQETVSFTITQSGKPCNIAVPGDFDKIQDAIDASSATGCTITVGDGTYNEKLRLWKKSITIRSVNGPGSTIIDNGGIGYGVEYNGNESSDSVLDGFTIQHTTGGLYFSASSPQVTNCIITENDSPLYGGAGIYCYQSSPTITDTIISSNTTASTLGGGGMMVRGGSSPTITNCTIRGNTATRYGGGITCYDGGSPIISNSAIIENIGYLGGGMYIEDRSSGFSSPTLTNCLILKNIARDPTRDPAEGNNGFGGGFSCRGGSLDLVNCTISENMAMSGGGIENPYGAAVTITNSILWGNAAQDPSYPPGGGPDRGNAFYPLYDVNALGVTFFNVTYSDVDQYVEGKGYIYPGTGNIKSNPYFAGAWSGNYHLTSYSPCLDTGTDDTTTYPLIPSDDFDGNSRPWDGNKDGTAQYDMGAYELVAETKPAVVDEQTPFINGELTVSYNTITSGGNTTVTALPGNPNPDVPPLGFLILGKYYNITTTATFSGPLEICFHYDDTGMTDEQELALLILHYEETDEEGDVWIDRTSSRDIGENIICAQVDELSPFVMAIPDADGDGYDDIVDCDDIDPNVNPGAVEVCSDGINNDCDDQTDDDCGGIPGDVDGDGNITGLDALLTFQHYLGVTQLDDAQRNLANVNGDNDITPDDALCIFRKYLGLDSCLGQ